MYNAKDVDSERTATDILCTNIVLIVTILIIITHTVIAIPVQLSTNRDGKILAETLFDEQWHLETKSVDAGRKFRKLTV